MNIGILTFITTFIFITISLTISVKALFLDRPRNKKTAWVGLGALFLNTAVALSLSIRLMEVRLEDLVAVALLNGLFVGIFLLSRSSVFAKDILVISVPEKAKTSARFFFITYLYFFLVMAAWSAASIFVFGNVEPKWGPIGSFNFSLFMIQPLAILFLVGTAIGRTVKRTESSLNALPMALLTGLACGWEINSLSFYIILPAACGVLGQLIPLSRLKRSAKQHSTELE